MSLNIRADQLSREQLFIVNELLQNITNLEERLLYLKSLGNIYEFVRDSEAYFLDERDYNIYTILKIGDQEWLGENLRFKPTTYYLNTQNPSIYYGCLYDWATVMGIEKTYNEKEWAKLTSSVPQESFWDKLKQSIPFFNKPIAKQHRLDQGIAPRGWHIPSDEEWMILEQNLEMNPVDIEMEGYHRGTNQADKLKARTEWKALLENMDYDSKESTSFAMFPAGSYTNGKFQGLGRMAGYWTSTEYKSPNSSVSTTALNRGVYTQEGSISRHFHSKATGLSCRCIRD